MRLAATAVLAALVTLAGAGPGWACDVKLRRPAPNCPAVTYGPDDCQGGTFGKAGDKLTAPATVNMMSSGHAYYCASHESCVPLEMVAINQCVLTYLPRQKEESPEYLGHIIVDTKQARVP